MIRLQFFGFPHAWVDEKPVKLSHKGYALLAYLAIEGRVSRRHLANLFWSGTLDALNNLSVVRGEIVNALGSAALEANSLSLAIGNVQCDLCDWQSSKDTQKRWSLCEREFLQGLHFREWQLGLGGEFEEWLEGQRRQYASERARLAVELAHSTLERGALRQALRWLEAAALDRFEPSEEAARWWFLTLGALGESALCSKAASTFTSLLLETYGGVPVTATQNMLELALSGNAAGCATLLRRELLTGQKHNQDVVIQATPLPLLGRDHEWIQMETAWQAGQLIVISGDIGIGKSLLALEFARSKGSFVQFGGKPGDSFLPYLTHARVFEQMQLEHPNLVLPDWVRLEMTRLIPTFEARSTPPNNEPDPLRFVTAQAEMYRLVALTAKWKTVLFDDFQLFDSASARVQLFLHSRLLPYQAEFTRSIVVFRSHELTPEIEHSLREWHRLGLAQWIELRPMTRKSTRQYLKKIDPRLENLAADVMRYTGGNPFLIKETAQALLKHGLQLQQIKLRDVPQAFEQMKFRLNQLPADALLLARLAALTGNQFSIQLAQIALDWSWQKVMETLDTLEKAGVYVGKNFTTTLMFETIIEGTSELLQNSLHNEVLQALEVLGVSARVRMQHALGANQFDKAQKYSVQAASEDAMPRTIAFIQPSKID